MKLRRNNLYLPGLFFQSIDQPINQPINHLSKTPTNLNIKLLLAIPEPSLSFPLLSFILNKARAPNIYYILCTVHRIL
jgi:hypothetical protein